MGSVMTRMTASSWTSAGTKIVAVPEATLASGSVILPLTVSRMQHDNATRPLGIGAGVRTASVISGKYQRTNRLSSLEKKEAINDAVSNGHLYYRTRICRRYAPLILAPAGGT